MARFRLRRSSGGSGLRDATRSRLRGIIVPTRITTDANATAMGSGIEGTAMMMPQPPVGGARKQPEPQESSASAHSVTSKPPAGQAKGKAPPQQGTVTRPKPPSGTARRN